VTEEALALRYRPKSFPEMVGNRMHAIVLANMVAEDKVPPVLIFSGPSGVGKTTAARILASELKATDVIEVDAASTGGVNEIRSILDVTRYSTGGGYRLIILDEAHSITRQGSEALLKTLEEPPEKTIFVLATTDPGKIDRTVKSRAMDFHFRPVSETEALERLTFVASDAQIPADTELLRYLAQRSRGDVRAAIQSLDMADRAGTLTLREFLDLAGEHDTVPVLVAALTTGDHSRVFAALDNQLAVISPLRLTSELVRCLIDILVIKAGGQLSYPNNTGSSLERRTRLAQVLDRERLLIAIKILWDAQTTFRTSEDPRSTLELALVLITEALTRNRDVRVGESAGPAPTATSPAPKKLTLAEMQRQKDSA
jgi:DNA polymerase-3 subunit gamma/tau